MDAITIPGKLFDYYLDAETFTSGGALEDECRKAMVNAHFTRRGRGFTATLTLSPEAADYMSGMIGYTAHWIGTGILTAAEVGVSRRRLLDLVAKIDERVAEAKEASAKPADQTVNADEQAPEGPTVVIGRNTYTIPSRYVESLLTAPPHPRNCVPGTLGKAMLRRQALRKEVCQVTGIPADRLRDAIRQLR